MQPFSTAVFTGISPHVSGLYRNEQRMRDALPRAELLPKSFSKAGYWSGGSGKMLHYFIDAPPGTSTSLPRKRKTLFRRPLDRPSVRSVCRGAVPGNTMKPTGGRSMAPMRNMEEIMRLPNGWANAFRKRESNCFFWRAAFIARTSPGSFLGNISRPFPWMRFNYRRVTARMISMI